MELFVRNIELRIDIFLWFFIRNFRKIKDCVREVLSDGMNVGDGKDKYCFVLKFYLY